MQAEAYAIEAEVEATHWWFTGRRELFAREIARLGLGPDAAILDVGTSTGTNLRMLRDIGMRNVRGLDFSPDAIRFVRSKGLGDVELGDVTAIPFADASFDLVLLTDVIEHVDDDLGALREVRRVLRPGGKAIVTVPAFPLLWGQQDDLALHKRRYRMRELIGRVQEAGFKIRSRYHFNYLLFVPILAARQLIKRLSLKVESENKVNSPLINWILTGVFRLDIATAAILRLPFGVSIYMLLERRA